MPDVDIRPLGASPAIVSTLSEILVEVVAHGGSVSFMHPLDLETARAFWDGSLAAADRDERIVLGAWDGEVLAGTVTLMSCPDTRSVTAALLVVVVIAASR